MSLPASSLDMLPADEQAQRMILWSLADSLYSLDPVTEIRLLADGEELELFGNIPVESVAVRPRAVTVTARMLSSAVRDKVRQ